MTTVTNSPVSRSARAHSLVEIVRALAEMGGPLLQAATEEADPDGVVLNSYLDVCRVKARLSAHLMKSHGVLA